MNEISSPIKNVPSCWNDDKRMAALYAPFRKRELNPLDYDSKIKFWENAFLNWCLEKDFCVLSIKKLQEEFRRKGKVPLCLNVIFGELVKKGDLRNKEDFVTLIPQQTWAGWAVNSLIKTPVIWSFSKIKEALIEIDPNEIEYVNLSYLKKRSEDLLNSIQGSNKCIFTSQEVKCLLQTPEKEISHDSLNLILHWLQINKKVYIKTADDVTVVKFVTKSNPGVISDQDMSLFILEENKVNLKKAIETLEKEKDETIESAKSYLRRGMRETAKTYLRKKKELEKTIAKRAAACENLEILSSRLQDVSSDAKVLESYKTAVITLKATLKENGLTEDVVHETISEMQEVHEMHEEIQTALSEPVSQDTDLELEEELMEIISSPYQPPDGGTSLPNVPTTKLPDVLIEEPTTPETKRILDLA